jgi:hypothetical protein
MTPGLRDALEAERAAQQQARDAVEATEPVDTKRLFAEAQAAREANAAAKASAAKAVKKGS